MAFDFGSTHPNNIWEDFIRKHNSLKSDLNRNLSNFTTDTLRNHFTNRSDYLHFKKVRNALTFWYVNGQTLYKKLQIQDRDKLYPTASMSNSSKRILQHIQYTGALLDTTDDDFLIAKAYRTVVLSYKHLSDRSNRFTSYIPTRARSTPKTKHYNILQEHTNVKTFSRSTDTQTEGYGTFNNYTFTPDKMQQRSVGFQTETTDNKDKGVQVSTQVVESGSDKMTDVETNTEGLTVLNKADKCIQSYEECLRLATMDEPIGPDKLDKCIQSYEDCLRLTECKIYNRRATLHQEHLPIFYYGDEGPTRQTRKKWYHPSGHTWVHIGQRLKIDCETSLA